MKKLCLFIFLNCLAVGTYAQFVDLGLPSGNLWKTENESGYFEFDEANAKFQDQLPCYGDWKELVDFCQWEWTGDGYKIIGENGKCITLPAAGGQACNGEWYNMQRSNRSTTAAFSSSPKTFSVNSVPAPDILISPA